MHHACFEQDTLNEKLKHRGAERLRHVQKPDEVISGGSGHEQKPDEVMSVGEWGVRRSPLSTEHDPTLTPGLRDGLLL